MLTLRHDHKRESPTSDDTSGQTSAKQLASKENIVALPETTTSASTSGPRITDMSTICMTVHDLRVLLGATGEDHDCHSSHPAVIVEEKTVDHWSAIYQLERSDLDTTIHHEEIEKLKKDDEKR